MKHFISCSILNFGWVENINPIEIEYNDIEPFKLVYNTQEIEKILSSFEFMDSFGKEGKYFREKYFVYYRCVEDIILDSDGRFLLLNNSYIECQLLSTALWFVKDNAVTPYFAVISSDEKITPISQRKDINYSDAFGEYKMVHFNKNELQEAMKWYSIILGYITDDKEKNLLKFGDTIKTGVINFDTPSFQRAFYYLESARTQSFLPAKISSYISVLETIFAVKGDNTQTVAQRSAYFIGESINERIEIYEDIKAVYGIRSSYVHGSEITNKKNNLIPKYCSRLDDIVRKVLKKAFLEHSDLNYKNKKDNIFNLKDNNYINKWFNELILGKE